VTCISHEVSQQIELYFYSISFYSIQVLRENENTKNKSDTFVIFILYIPILCMYEFICIERGSIDFITKSVALKIV